MPPLALKIIKTILSLLPKPVLYQILKLQKIKALDLSRLYLIRKAILDDLKNPQKLEHNLLPQLGLNIEHLYQFPKELYPYRGQGLLCWQYPNQFSKFLVQISQFKIESYLEIGVRHGGTFVTIIEYLNRFHPIKMALGIDICNCPSLLEYQKINPAINFLQIDSTSAKFKEIIHQRSGFDLVLIDGDHDEGPCRKDFELVKNKAKIIVLHDVISDACPGVVNVWQEIKRNYIDEYYFFEYLDQYKEVLKRTGKKFLGIGMVIKKDYFKNLSFL